MVTGLLSIWTWLVIALVVLVGFWIELALFLVTWPFDRGRRVPGRFLRLMAVAASTLTPLWRFRIHGPTPRRPRRKTVVVSNHQSHADVFCISRLPWEMKWLAKSVLFWVPFMGWCLWLAGDVPVRRGTRSSALDAMARCARWLERGVPVAIFPEGTRSPTPDLLPFKDGAFRLAIESGADVLPVAVAGTRRALPKHSWRFGFARALVTVGEPIRTEGMTLDDLERLKAEARERILALRTELERHLAEAAPEASLAEGARSA